MDRPVAVYGVHNSPRIVSQRGVFTLFGRSMDPMEDVFTAGAFEDGTLQKIEINGVHQESVFRELLGAGVLDSTVFPDLDGLARELKRSAGFGAR
ncbi:hypothetical protein [Arenimonas terrae]|nr:hypothetical protein [Arenimonas terrae]